MAYAKDTKVTVDKSIGEILSLLKRAGATRVAQGETETGIAIQCFLQDRMLRFAITFRSWEEVPEYGGNRYRSNTQRLAIADQWKRQRARALLLVIKAKLESIESEVESFDEAFLANVVTPGGATVAEWLVPQIEEGYRIGKMPTQLLIEGR